MLLVSRHVPVKKKPLEVGGDFRGLPVPKTIEVSATRRGEHGYRNQEAE
jgi:hypothetical protein